MPPLRAPVDAFSRLPPGVRAPLIMIASCAGFAGMIALIRHTAEELRPFEIAFLRNVVGMLVMLPVFLRVGPGALRTGRFGLHLLRAALGFAITDASALMPYDFSRLIFVGILGYAFFGETPDLWTWLGGLVIASSSIYVATREARRVKRAAAAVGPDGA